MLSFMERACDRALRLVVHKARLRISLASMKHTRCTRSIMLLLRWVPLLAAPTRPPKPMIMKETIMFSNIVNAFIILSDSKHDSKPFVLSDSKPLHTAGGLLQLILA